MPFARTFHPGELETRMTTLLQTHSHLLLRVVRNAFDSFSFSRLTKDSDRRSHGTPKSISHFSPHDLPSSTLSNPVIITDALPQSGNPPFAALPQPDHHREPSKPKSESPEPQNEVHSLHPSISGTPQDNRFMQQEQAPNPFRNQSSQFEEEAPQYRADPITHMPPPKPRILGLETPDRPPKVPSSASAPESRLGRPFDTKKRRSSARIRGINTHANTSSQDIWEPPDTESGSSQSLPQLPDANSVETRHTPHLFSQVNGALQDEQVDSVVRVMDPLNGWPKIEVKLPHAHVSAGDQNAPDPHFSSTKDPLSYNTSTQDLSQNLSSVQDVDESRPSIRETTEDLIVSGSVAFTPINGVSQDVPGPDERAEGSPMEIVEEESSHYHSRHPMDFTNSVNESSHQTREIIAEQATDSIDVAEKQVPKVTPNTTITKTVPANFTSVNSQTRGDIGNDTTKSKKRKKETRESSIRKHHERQSESELPFENRLVKTGSYQEPKQAIHRGNESTLNQEAEKNASKRLKRQLKEEQKQDSQTKHPDQAKHEISRGAEQKIQKQKTKQDPLAVENNSVEENGAEVKQSTSSNFGSSQLIRESSTPKPSKVPPACIECKKKKKKCDRGDPCASCAKSKMYCKYPGQTTTMRREQSLTSSQLATSEKTTSFELLRKIDNSSGKKTEKGSEKSKLSDKLMDKEKRQMSEEKVQKRVDTTVTNVKETVKELRRSESRESSAPRPKPDTKSKSSSRKDKKASDSYKNEIRRTTHLDPQTPLPKSALRSSPAMSPFPSKRSVSFIEEPEEGLVDKGLASSEKLNGVPTTSGSKISKSHSTSFPDPSLEDSEIVTVSKIDTKKPRSSLNGFNNSVQTTLDVTTSRKRGKARLFDTSKQPTLPKEAIKPSKVPSSEDESEPPAIDGVAGPSKLRASSRSKSSPAEPSTGKPSRSNIGPSSTSHKAAKALKDRKAHPATPPVHLDVQQNNVESNFRSKSMSRSPAKEVMSDDSSHSSSSSGSGSSDDEGESEDDHEDRGEGSLQKFNIQTIVNKKSGGKVDYKKGRTGIINKSSTESSSSNSESKDDSSDGSDDGDSEVSNKQVTESSQTTDEKKVRKSSSKSNAGEHSTHLPSSASASKNEDIDKGLLNEQKDLPKDRQPATASFRTQTASASQGDQARNGKEESRPRSSLPAKSDERNSSQAAKETLESSESSSSAGNDDGSSDESGDTSEDSSGDESKSASGDEAERQLQREAQQSTEPTQSRSKTTLETKSERPEVTKPIQNGYPNAAKPKNTLHNGPPSLHDKFPSLSNLVSNPNVSSQQRRNFSGFSSFSDRNARPQAREPLASKQLIDLESESSYESSESEDFVETDSRQIQSAPKHLDRGLKGVIKRMSFIASVRKSANKHASSRAADKFSEWKEIFDVKVAKQGGSGPLIVSRISRTTFLPLWHFSANFG